MVTPAMLQNVRNNLLKRASLCIQVGGGRFEHVGTLKICYLFEVFLVFYC
jgi:hypothetical protein